MKKPQARQSEMNQTFNEVLSPFVPFSDVLVITMAVLRTSTEQTPRDVAERPSDPVTQFFGFWKKNTSLVQFSGRLVSVLGLTLWNVLVLFPTKSPGVCTSDLSKSATHFRGLRCCDLVCGQW